MVTVILIMHSHYPASKTFTECSPFAIRGFPARLPSVVVGTFIDTFFFRGVHMVRGVRHSSGGLTISSVVKARIPVALVGAFAARRRRFLPVMAVGFSLRHPDVFRTARAHVTGVVFQLADQVFEIADSDGSTRRDLIFFLVFHLQDSLECAEKDQQISGY